MGDPGGRRRPARLAWAYIFLRGTAMPTYEYRCRDCHHVFDRIEPIAEHGHTRPACPKCKSKKVEQVLTSFFAKTSHKS
jgi:putative FmdB family regulatory protein